MKGHAERCASCVASCGSCKRESNCGGGDWRVSVSNVATMSLLDWGRSPPLPHSRGRTLRRASRCKNTREVPPRSARTMLSHASNFVDTVASRRGNPFEGGLTVCRQCRTLGDARSTSRAEQLSKLRDIPSARWLALQRNCVTKYALQSFCCE